MPTSSIRGGRHDAQGKRNTRVLVWNAVVGSFPSPYRDRKGLCIVSHRIVGGFRTGSDGRVHGRFHHNPSTLRLSMSDPNLQQVPRGTADEVHRWVKECFVAPPGSTFWEVDYSGIEAVLVGYFAGAKQYYRLARLGVHAFFASHMVGQPADLSWSDDDLRAYFKLVKQQWPLLYDTAKRCVHLSNYRGTPHRMHIEYPETFSTVKDASTIQGKYFELFPEIPLWHRALCERVDAARKHPGEDATPWSLGVAYVRNPFGYVHRFYHVLDWKKIDGEWSYEFGDDAKRLISNLPQSTAAAIMKDALKRVWYQEPDIGRCLRLTRHDSIMGECDVVDADRQVSVVSQIMTAPLPALPLDPEWEMGEHVSINVEAKVGSCWATMH